MGIVVDHEQRKTVILKKALDVIIEEGYEDATFQKIADRCGITRTTLYIYFKNKREIFLWSIKQLTEGLEIALQDIIGDTSRSCKERLLAVLEGIVHGCIENRQLFLFQYFVKAFRFPTKSPPAFRWRLQSPFR